MFIEKLVFIFQAKIIADPNPTDSNKLNPTNVEKLIGIAIKAEGLSGHILRELPYFTQSPSVQPIDLYSFLEALDAVVDVHIVDTMNLLPKDAVA